MCWKPCLLPPDQWAGVKEFFVFLLDCKGWRVLRKRGCCVCAWEGWRKITQFPYSFHSLLMEAKGDTGSSTHVLGFANCSWRTQVAHCIFAKRLPGKICLILSCWKLNKISPCPFACSLRKLWVRESHEPSVCTLTSPRLHQFTSDYKLNFVFVHTFF